MLPGPCYVFSDAHLGHATVDVERETLAFLRHVGEQAGSLVINGDLFEFWFEWRHVIPRSAFRVLARLAELRESGLPIVMLAGNHDCWGGEVLRRDVGVDYRFDPLTGTLAGWRAHIEHGDGLRRVEDARYRALRRVLRHPMSIRAFRWLPADLASRLAYGSSDASRTHTSHDAGAGLRSVALARLAAHPELQLVAFGHTHAARLDRAPGGGVYANSGAWIADRTYLVIDEARIALRRWMGSSESADLDVLDRPPEKTSSEP